MNLRFGASVSSKADLDRLGMEIAPLILTGPGSVTGFEGGRPKAADIVAYRPALISESAFQPTVTLFQL